MCRSISATQRIGSLGLLFCCLLATSSCGNDNPDVAVIRQVFLDYKTAIFAEDGYAAALLVDADTLELYDDFVALACMASEEETRKLSFVRRYTVLAMRQRVDPDELCDMDGSEMFALSISEGWTGKNSMANVGIAAVTVTDDFAVGVMTVNGNAMAGRFRFTRSGEKWGLNIAWMLTQADIALKQSVVESGMPENEYIFRLLEAFGGKRVDESIWQPVGSTNPS